MDEMYQYKPDDILDEEVSVQWETRPPDSSPLCPRGHGPMARRTVSRKVASGQFAVEYEEFICSDCGETFLDREQARRYAAIQLLDRLLKEREAELAGGVLFDGHDAFVRLDLAHEMAMLWRQAVEAHRDQ